MDATKIFKGSQEMVIEDHTLRSATGAMKSYKVPFERTYKMKNRHKQGIPKIQSYTRPQRQSHFGKSVLDSPDVVRDRELMRVLNEGPSKLSAESFKQSLKKIVPPQDTYQGYQRSGMLLFNNINNYDANAFQNNQTFKNQTMNQVVADRSMKSLQPAMNIYSEPRRQIGLNKNLRNLTTSKDSQNLTSALNDFTRSQESLTSQQDGRRGSCQT